MKRKVTEQHVYIASLCDCHLWAMEAWTGRYAEQTAQI